MMLSLLPPGADLIPTQKRLFTEVTLPTLTLHPVRLNGFLTPSPATFPAVSRVTTSDTV